MTLIYNDMYKNTPTLQGYLTWLFDKYLLVYSSIPSASILAFTSSALSFILT